MHKLAISEVTTDKWTLDQDVFGYKQAGVDGIGVWWNKLRDYGVDKGIALLEQENMHVSTLIGIGWFTRDDRSQIRPCIPDTRQAIDLAGKLKADCLTVVAGPPGQYTKRDALQIALNSIKDLLPYAEENDVRLALEPLHPMNTGKGSVVNASSMALDVIESINSPNLGVYLDTYHIWWDYHLDIQIPRAKGRIFGVHINDWREPPRDTNRDRAMMGEGIIPLKEILELIEGTGYKGFYEVELLSEDLWALDHNELVRRCVVSFENIWK